VYGASPLFPSGLPADTQGVIRFVSVVICVAFVVPAAGAARKPTLLATASKRSGLSVRHGVRVTVERGARFDADARRAFDRDYPPALQRTDDALYAGLGLMTPQRLALASAIGTSRALYDRRARVLRIRRAPAPSRAAKLRELVRALVDQNFGLRRLTGLRERDRDAFIAALGIVDGVSSHAAGLHARPARGTALDRFLAAERDVGRGPGRSLVATLRSLGGRFAVATALHTFPRTTEQLLHVDKLLEREPALPVALPSEISDLRLAASETFGELDVQALLRAFAVRDADLAAAGWGGGRLALYAPAAGEPTVAFALRWDTDEDAAEWERIVPSFVTAAFPAATVSRCPAVATCWLDGSRELAVAARGRTTTFASGPAGELVAATLMS
jgi:hypothetical protein